MNIETLAKDLADVAIGVRTEERGRVAVLIPEAALPLDGPTRRRIVALAREHGFTNVCLELTPRDANLPGD